MKIRRTAFLCLIVGITLLIVTSPSPGKSTKVVKDWTQYYWFDPEGNYLWRQNMIHQEIDLTGFDEFEYAPYTIREKGFSPAGVTGNPPVPNNVYAPDRVLYSHP